MEPTVHPTAAFVAGTKPTAKPKSQCPFCKGPHPPSSCTVVIDTKQCTNIIRQERLFYNCFGHHKISTCNSKHRFHHCHRRHHTSLCSLGHQNDSRVTPSIPKNSTPQQHSPRNPPTTSEHHPSVGVSTVASTQPQPIAARPTTQVSQQSAPLPQPQQQHSTQLQLSVQPTATATGVHSVSLPSQQSNHCLLKTAIARVRNRQCQHFTG